jgi:hypothetical protein
MKTTAINANDLGSRGLTIRVHDIPEKLRPAVNRVLCQCLPFAPRWLRELSIEYDHDDRDSNAKIKPQVYYRKARLSFSDSFALLDDRRQRLIMLHELAHLWQEPLRQSVDDCMKPLVQGPVGPISKEVIMTAEETVAEDLAYFFNEMFESGAVEPIEIGEST